MSTKYILHGGYTRLENELNYSFFREFVKDIPDNGKVIMCFFASGNEDKTDTYSELCNKLLKAGGGKRLNFILASTSSFIDEISQSDAVYFHGGNTRALLKALEKYPNLHKYFEHKTVAGSSAGAYMLVKLGAAHTEDNVREGLGFINAKVVCHFESPTMPPTINSFEQLVQMEPELETIYLKDCEWHVIKQ